MIRWSPALVAALVTAIIGFGLGYTLKQAIVVAPWAEQAQVGRLHSHTKNVTRLSGSPAEVQAAVHRAVYLEEDGGMAADYSNWQAAIATAVQVSESPTHVIALAGEGEQALAWALPGAYWARYAGVPVVFLAPDSVSAETEALLRDYRLPVYVLAPASRVADAVIEHIRQRLLIPVGRVSGDDLPSHAVAIAQYRDSTFGWGRTHDQRDGYFHYVVATPAEAEQALAALPLAASNAATLLFAEDTGGLPAATDRYIWSQRADWFVTPSEGPFRHFWVVGNRLSYAAQARLDLSVEKADYPSMGPVALGPMEALAIVFIALGLAGGVLVLFHGMRLLPEVMLATRLAWAFTAVLFPIAGVLLYFAAYRRPRLNPDQTMAHWLRPPAIQGAAATAMGFGYGAPLMVAIGYLFVYFGFPLFYGEWADGWEFLFGAGMPLMMAGMYIGAILIAWPLVQLPMKAMMEEEPSQNVIWLSLGVTVLSMSAVSLGMMTTSWWLLMERLPMMPKEDEILWFGSLWLASTLGFLIAWPLNWAMIRGHLKPGAM